MRRNRIGREPGPPGGGVGAPRRVVAIPDGDSMRGIDAAARDRVDGQQLVRQVPFGDALVARGSFRIVESDAAAREEPGLVRQDSARRARSGQVARLRRGAMAEDGWPRRRGQPIAYWPAADLATAASDLLRGALLQDASGPPNSGTLPTDRF